MYPKYMGDAVAPVEVIERSSDINSNTQGTKEGCSIDFGVFYQDLKPLLLAMKILATLPLSASKSGEMVFRMLSPSTMYTVLVYLSVMGLWFTYVMKMLASQLSFEHLVDRLSVITYFLLAFFLPFTLWRETRGFAAYINNWRQFEVQFNQMTRRTLKLNLHHRTLVLLAFSITISFTLETTYVAMKRHLKVTKWLINIYQTTFRYFLGSFFYLLCIALVRAAENILDFLKTDVKGRSVKSGAALAAYRVLWLKLSRLSEQVGTSCCYTFGFYILYLFLNLTLCLYLSCSYTSNIKNIVINTETTVTSILLLFVMCDAGQAVSEQVTKAFQDELLNMRTEPAHPVFDREVDTFLSVIQIQNSAVRLGGFVVVNRRLIVSLASALITYLIVLLQFQSQAK